MTPLPFLADRANPAWYRDRQGALTPQSPPEGRPRAANALKTISPSTSNGAAPFSPLSASIRRSFPRTAMAGINLLERAGAKVVGCSFVIDLPELGGADKLRKRGMTVSSLVAFEGH